MASCGNGKKSKKGSQRKHIRRWIIKHPKLFAFLLALAIIAGAALYKPDYVEPIARAFVLLIGVGL